MVCEEHRNDTVFCCENKNLDAAQMLMCEFCLCWYHAKCEQVSGTAMDDLESFKCRSCVDWQQKYETVFKSVIERGESDEIIVPKSTSSSSS